MDLEKDGFDGAQTVSAFLARGKLADYGVVIVDEAGQIGGKQMLALLELAREHTCRLILSGDTRQHGAVEASDALRAIEKYSGARVAELTNIRRQNPGLARTKEERQRIRQYRQAVTEARDGKLAQSFDRLDKQGAITQCTLANQHEKLIEHYLELVKARHRTVVVSQSWNEIHEVNEQIRRALKAEKLIGETDGKTPVRIGDLFPINKWTEAYHAHRYAVRVYSFSEYCSDVAVAARRGLEEVTRITDPDFYRRCRRSRA